MHPPDPQRPNRESDEKVLILPLGEESKKITQTLSNDSARQGFFGCIFVVVLLALIEYRGRDG